MIEVDLKPGLRGGPWARLRELRGDDELWAAQGRGASSLVAVELLDRLLVAAPGTTIAPGRARELAVGDRDRLLAAIYRHTFGKAIESTTNCTACGEGFDLAFDLGDLLPPRADLDDFDEDGCLVLEGGRRVRLPNLDDELALRGLSGAAATACLVRRLVVDGDPEVDPAAVLGAVEAASPIAERELIAACPECGTHQAIHFVLQSFLLAALAREGEWLTREVHRLAVTYHWPLGEILALPRSQRRRFVALIEREAAARRRVSR